MTKFTKQEAIKALEAKIPAKDKELDLGRTISEAVDNSLELIGEDSEMELEDFVAKVFKQVKTSIGLTHSENSKVATKMQSQIDELQRKVNGKNQQTDDGKGDDDNPTMIYHKTAITMSATILVICMFVLGFAVHPAVSSISFASTVGMITTIILSYTIEPILYRFYIKIKNKKKKS